VIDCSHHTAVVPGGNPPPANANPPVDSGGGGNQKPPDGGDDNPPPGENGEKPNPPTGGDTGGGFMDVLDGANTSFFANAPGAPTVQNIVITININTDGAAPGVSPGQGTLPNGSHHESAANRPQFTGTHAHVRLAAYRLGSPSHAPADRFPSSRTLSRQFLESPTSAAGLTFSIASNGNLGSNALQFRVHDPSGKLKGNIALPEGVVLEPLKMGTPSPVGSAPGGSNISQPLTAYCLEMAKLPPQAGQLYRLAPPAVQQKYKPIHAVLQVGSKLAAAGKFHPDSDPAAYTDFIRQHALWAQLENWSEQKFTEVFLERTRKNAEHLNVKWTNEMNDALRAAAPGRWRDIAMVLDEAHKLSGRAGAP